MAVATNVAQLNGLFNDIFENSKLIYEEEALMPRLVTLKQNGTMAPRILSSYNSITPGTVAEGAAPTPGTQIKTPDGTIVPVIIHHQEELTDEDQMTDPDGAVQTAWKRMGRGMVRKVDADLAAEFTNFTSQKGTAGSAVTVGHVSAAMAKLDSERVSGTRFGVWHPFAWQRFATQLTGINNNPINGSAGELFNRVMREYYGGDWLGLRNFLSNANGTGTAVANGVFTREAIIYDVRTPYHLVPDRDESRRAHILNGVTRYGKGVDRKEAGVKVVGLATEPS